MAEEKIVETQANETEYNDLVRVRREKLANLVAEGKDPFEITKYDVDTTSEKIKTSYEELEGKSVKIAGRIMSRRIMGKASFAHVADSEGTIQIYVKRDDKYN